MKITALFLVRDESWVLGCSLRAALEWVDDCFVLDHCSTDRTEEIAQSFGRHVVYERMDDPEFRELTFRHLMLERARMRGATHIAMLDADEIISGNLLPKMRGLAADLQPGHCLAVPMICVWRGLDQYRSDSNTVFFKAKTPVLMADHPSLDWAPKPDGYELHGRAPNGTRSIVSPYTNPTHGGVLHLQWASWDRLVWKQVHYVLRERAFYGQRDTAQAINERYQRSVDETGMQLSPIPKDWWAPYMKWRDQISLEGDRWHKAECFRMAKQIGLGGMKGLNLFGVKPEFLLSNNEEAS